MAAKKALPGYNGLSIAAYPLSYMGVNPTTPPNLTAQGRNPTTQDIDFAIGSLWITRVPYTLWILMDLANNTATWIQLYPESGAGLAFQTDSGTAMPSSGVIIFDAISQAGSSVYFSGSGSTVSLNTSDANDNTIIGNTAGNASLSGSQNTVIGYGSLHNVTSASHNVIVGYGSGTNYTTSESNNILLGAGNLGVVAESNVLRIGNGTGSSAGNLAKAFICGIDGVNVGNTANVVTEVSNQLGTAVLTAGTGITITPTANTITIASTGGGGVTTWTVITTNTAAAVNNGYIVNGGSTLTITLPSVAAVGAIIRITGLSSADGWTIAQNAGQKIVYGISTSTVGVSGSVSSTEPTDTIELVCVVANTTFNVLSSIGFLTVV